jgi:hypothetical protein
VRSGLAGEHVSEYQCYEFVALDRPLTAQQMAELRAISTRAEISRTRFWNEYQWGDLKAAPAKLMERYFDAHLYFANWGTHQLMLRIPKARVDRKSLKPYFVGRNAAPLTSIGDHLLLDLSSDTDEPEYDEQSQGSLAALSPLRAELMSGDLRPAYLAWLLAVAADDIYDDAEEPPVPAGLRKLTAAQEALLEFLRIDIDLVAAAASGSAATATTKGKHSGTRRSVGELRALADTKRAEREKAEAERAKKAKAAAASARQRYLTKLARDVEGAWAKLEKLVETSDYDVAVKLAVDLRDLATRDGRAAGFARRFEALRKRHMRRRGFYDRWKRANENTSEGR